MQTVTLTFNGITQTLTSNNEGMFDLNDVWRTWVLQEPKRPNRFTRNDQGRYFLQTAKLASGTVPTGRRNGTTQSYLGNQEVLYAYAMWCDVEFYAAVVQAFTHIANNDVEAARAVVSEVTRVREELRSAHSEVTRNVAAAEGLQHMSSSNRQTHFHNLVCKATFGIGATVFRRRYGLTPRDWFQQADSAKAAYRYQRNLNRAELMCEQGMTYKAIKDTLGEGDIADYEDMLL